MNTTPSRVRGLALMPLTVSWISSKLGFPTSRYREDRSRIFSERLFSHILATELARSGKRRSPAVMATLQVNELQGKDGRLPPLVEDLLFSVLLVTLRETDIVGWQREDETMGVILTEFGQYSNESATEVILAKLEKAIQQSVPASIVEKVAVDVVVMDVPADGTSAAGSSVAPRDGSALKELATAANS